jgi:hypothetical protein
MTTITGDDRSAVFDGALGHALSRLELLIEQETSALRHASVDDLRDFNNRKAQAFVELNRAMGSVAGQAPSPDMSLRLTALREKLETNRRKLKMHLDAVQEVAGMLADQIRNADSDGTYSYGIRKNGAQL